MNVWIVLGIILFDVLFTVTLIGAICNASWGTLMKNFPPKPVLPEHIRRNYQSYKIGIFGLGWSVHTIVDDDHLHLIPIRLMRWYGCTMVSIPWNQVEDHPRPGRARAIVRVKIGKQDVYGPRWALDCRTELRKK